MAVAEDVQTAVKRYELMVLTPGDQVVGEVEKTVDSVRHILKEHKGKILLEDIWGKRRLAFRIKGNSEGNYAIFYFSVDPSKITAIEHALRIEGNVIRYLLIAVPEGAELKKFEFKKIEKPTEKKKPAKKLPVKEVKIEEKSVKKKEEEKEEKEVPEVKEGAVEEKLEEETPEVTEKEKKEVVMEKAEKAEAEKEEEEVLEKEETKETEEPGKTEEEEEKEEPEKAEEEEKEKEKKSDVELKGETEEAKLDDVDAKLKSIIDDPDILL